MLLKNTWRPSGPLRYSSGRGQRGLKPPAPSLKVLIVLGFIPRVDVTSALHSKSVWVRVQGGRSQTLTVEGSAERRDLGWLRELENRPEAERLGTAP